jgi:putative endonuclease
MSADATATTAAWVYLLRCADGSLYCGWTVDVERRVRQHQAGHASRYTRTRLPVTLAFVARMETHQAARREEARIKRLTRIEKLALITPARVGSQAWLENTS